MNEQSTSGQVQEVKVLANGTANEAATPNEAAIPNEAATPSGIENIGQLTDAGGLGVSPAMPNATPNLSPDRTSDALDECAVAEPARPRAAPRVMVKSPSRLKVAKAALAEPLAVEGVATAAENRAEFAAGIEIAKEPEVPVGVAVELADAMPAVVPGAGLAEPAQAKALDTDALTPDAAHPDKGEVFAEVVLQAHSGQPRQNPQAVPAKPPLPDPRRRLRELLAIPDRDRSDALWDELIELEIQLAPGNRAQSPHQVDTGRQPKQQRFAEPGRRSAASPSAGANRHYRSQGNVHGLQGAGNSVANPNGGPAVAGPGNPGMAKPGKRFFKKSRRGPRPADKV
ncbi:MAG: hypothetical protein WA112_00405 [Rugosibacter sp.]|jgi:hypothetical protein|nr:hypothetical protein [Rugosibacter sp.]